ncbi:response regulator [Herminiimonas fonticola]|uniref:Hpt domain-containing protein n=1 Tax=Herminiimonas fonticola TaxID=303380 RepID=A0A4R6G748_9BURK|nr:response regulator [Herminiimonas fonticola]RBA23798.1 Response regulator receiver domain [Herminiimonas fonticola]TDN89800.1 Hpt domain-containing protein [Herminiimonas fonticola]
MSPIIRFKVKPLTAVQRGRKARRREDQNSEPSKTKVNVQLLDDLQRMINTQMHGIIGVLEMVRKNDLASDQSDMIHLAQDSAENLLLEVDQLLASDPHFASAAPLDITSNPIAYVKMMLVDPDADNRSRIEKKLQQRVVRIDSFALPKDALTALDQAAVSGDPYRIVLLDQNIQGIDGETLGMAISSSPLYRDALIVLISDQHHRSDATRLTNAGFSAWLPKPASDTTLLNTLNMLCTCIAKKDAPRFVCAGVRQTTHANAGNAEALAIFSDARILAVDDNPMNLQVVKQMLVRFGCRVDTASSGQQALQMAHEHHYDLVLMDCQMPQMDGYQTTALLRAMESADNHTLIIGWSAGGKHNVRDTCLAIGMDDFIAKPIRLKTLHELLIRWLPTGINNTTATMQQDDELDATLEMFGEDFAELAHLFLNDSPKRLTLLNTAIGERDATVTARLAHVLCGSTASIGATALAALCRDLEIQAKNNELDDALLRLNAIELEYARIDEKLHHMLHAAAPTEPSGLRDPH